MINFASYSMMSKRFIAHPCQKMFFIFIWKEGSGIVHKFMNHLQMKPYFNKYTVSVNGICHKLTNFIDRSQRVFMLLITHVCKISLKICSCIQGFKIISIGIFCKMRKEPVRVNSFQLHQISDLATRYIRIGIIKLQNASFFSFRRANGK